MRIMDTVHKKNGRLHIYVRQDKYKGELKSHNWVGRIYIDGKQKIVSSGTTELEKATIILEKWFDDLHLKREQSNNIPKKEDNISRKEGSIPRKEDSILKKEEETEINDQNKSNNIPPTRGLKLGMFEKLKNIKLSKKSFGQATAEPKTPEKFLKIMG